MKEILEKWYNDSSDEQLYIAGFSGYSDIHEFLLSKNFKLEYTDEDGNFPSQVISLDYYRDSDSMWMKYQHFMESGEQYLTKETNDN